MHKQRERQGERQDNKDRKTRHDKSDDKTDKTRPKLTVKNCQLGRAKINNGDTVTNTISGVRLLLIVMFLVRNPSKPIFKGIFFTFIYMYYGPPILKVFRITDLNLKRFLAYWKKHLNARNFNG